MLLFAEVFTNCDDDIDWTNYESYLLNDCLIKFNPNVGEQKIGKCSGRGRKQVSITFLQPCIHR